MLNAWSKAGDILARASLSAVSGSAGLVAGGTNVSAKGTTAIHAAIAGNTSVVPVTTGITNPTVPRNLLITFAASWDGGDVVVVGTDQFDRPVTETFLSNAGATRVGTKIFKTVTSVAHTAVGATANTYSTGDGDKLGVVAVPAANSPILLAVGGVGEAVTFDFTYNAFTPTSIPNGSRSYVLTMNL
jgi:hypothetical protein